MDTMDLQLLNACVYIYIHMLYLYGFILRFILSCDSHMLWAINSNLVELLFPDIPYYPDVVGAHFNPALFTDPRRGEICKASKEAHEKADVVASEAHAKGMAPNLVARLWLTSARLELSQRRQTTLKKAASTDSDLSRAGNPPFWTKLGSHLKPPESQRKPAGTR